MSDERCQEEKKAIFLKYLEAVDRQFSAGWSKSLPLLPYGQRSRGSRRERSNLASPKLSAPTSAQRTSLFPITATSS